MLNKLPQYKEILSPNSVSVSEIIEYINSHIGTNSCEKLNVDISFLNILDSCHITTICSTTHYIKYPNGKINWIVSSEMIKTLNDNLSLGNCEYTINKAD